MYEGFFFYSGGILLLEQGGISMNKQRWIRFLMLFCFGGGGYVLLERLWRGYSHWSMFLAGGCCFHLIGRIGKKRQGKNKAATAGVCALAVTAVEYVCGRVVNVRLKLNVWDYSHMFGNLHGQVCMLYTILWGLLSLPVIPLYRYLHDGCSRVFSRWANIRKGTGVAMR